MKKVFSLILLSSCLLLTGCGSEEQKVEETVNSGKVTCSQMKEKVSYGAILIDVRTEEEYAVKHLDGAINIDYKASNFVELVEKEITDKNTVIVVYCQSGTRAGYAMDLLIEDGYKNVYNLGGISACES